MIRIRKKKSAAKPVSEKTAKKNKFDIESDAFFAGSFPGKPWERLTHIRHGRGMTLNILNSDEQNDFMVLAKKYFSFEGSDFASARLEVQRELDEAESKLAEHFFKRAIFTEKRLLIRGYLSDAAGRFIPSVNVLKLMKYFADVGLDFEVGAINHFIDGKRKTELVIGDGTEVISDKGYWYVHTHPARPNVTDNILPSTADIDVIIITARSYAHNLDVFETSFFVFRDIGGSHIKVYTSKEGQPASAKIEKIIINYYIQGEKDPTIGAHIDKLLSHIRMRHRLKTEQVEINPCRSWDEIVVE